jgi:pilus assembly protein Flp/PilA
MFRLKKIRQPTEETCDRSVTGESTPKKTKKEEKGMMREFLAKMSDEKGQGLVEYALIIVLVSIVAIVTLGLLGTTVSGVFTTITNAL